MNAADIAAGLSPDALDDMKERLLQRVVLKVEAESKKETPVRTGNLRRSVTSRVERATMRGFVGTNVNYAPEVHDRNPFFERGIANSRDAIVAMLAAAGQELFSKVTS